MKLVDGIKTQSIMLAHTWTDQESWELGHSKQGIGMLGAGWEVDEKFIVVSSAVPLAQCSKDLAQTMGVYPVQFYNKNLAPWRRILASNTSSQMEACKGAGCISRTAIPGFYTSHFSTFV